MRHTGEPSVEEILESIKKVIARDNRASAAIERQRRETQGLQTPPADEPAIDETLDEEDDVLELDALADEYADDADEMDSDLPVDDAPLVNPDARASMRDSLAALAMLAQPGVPPQIVRSGETSLEGMVRDLLKPALAEWLDKNLPPMVERLVAAEIARIVGKKG